MFYTLPMKKFSHVKGVKKAVIAGVIFGIPVLLQILPSDFLNLTVGAVLAYILNYAKVKYL